MPIILIMILTISNLRWKWLVFCQSSKVFVFVFGHNSFEGDLYR